jgi:hypothetical protein
MKKVYLIHKRFEFYLLLISQFNYTTTELIQQLTREQAICPNLFRKQTQGIAHKIREGKLLEGGGR